MIESRDRGSTAVLLMAAVAIALSFAVRVGVLGNSAVHLSTLQSVADATALAGVIGSRAAAESIAGANSATLVHFRESPPDAFGRSEVHVIVEMDGRRADARASDAH